MKRVPVLLSLAPTLLLAAWAVEASSAQRAASSCESLTSLKLPETTIVAAQAVAAGAFTPPVGRGGDRGGPAPAGTAGQEAAGLPAFCRVAGTVAPEIHFEVWLPSPTGEKSWNGRFNGVGNGGLAGAISYGAMMRSLARGYATASTDTGHTNEPGKEAWALGHPERLVDFATRSIHMTARAAKRVIEAYYGRAARFSYFTGCSCGGGQGLSEAQRYPADYDGIVAGAPANFPTRMWPGELYPAWVTHRDAASLVPREKLPLVNDAALAACDTLDGVKDGVLEDPRHCRFDPSTLQCKGTDGPTCLTAAQVDSVGRIYKGLMDPSSGTVFWPGYEISSELGWPGHIFEPSGPPVSYFKYMALQDPGWDSKTLDFSDPKQLDVLIAASNRLGPILDSVNPDLTAFKRLGGKLIVYHGWIDQNIAPRNSIRYHEAVQDTMGGESQTQSFFRLFMVPGMGHCGGGPGPSTFDALAALEEWVENGKAPAEISASRVSQGALDRTRPLCPYPQTAAFKGTGSTDEAASFECRASPR